MLTLAHRARGGAKASIPVLTITSAVWDGATINENAYYGVSISVSGGVAPYTYKMLIGGTIKGSYQTNNAYSYPNSLADSSWNGQSVQAQVTDAAGTTVTSASLGTLAVNWIGYGGGVSVSSATPPPGTFISCSMAVSANPAPTTYTWSYRTKPAGGSWGAWTAWAAPNNALVYTGTFTTVGDQWEFQCTATNSVGSRTDTSTTVTVV